MERTPSPFLVMLHGKGQILQLPLFFLPVFRGTTSKVHPSLIRCLHIQGKCPTTQQQAKGKEDFLDVPPTPFFSARLLGESLDGRN